MLRVRFIGTSSGDYEFKPYDLIGEVNAPGLKYNK